QYIPKAYPGYVQMGLPDTLRKKKASVIAFLKAINKAQEYVASQPPATTATVLHKATNYSTTDVATLTEALKASLLFNPAGPRRGYISEETWKYAIQQYPDWALDNTDPGSDPAQYAARVDMSYYNEAFGAS